MTFTKNLANYLTQYRIRVNQINPGWTLTEGERHVIGVVEGKGENWLEAAEKTRPFGRMLLPADVAKAVLFFATNELISGAVLDYEQIPFGAPAESGKVMKPCQQPAVLHGRIAARQLRYDELISM